MKSTSKCTLHEFRFAHTTGDGNGGVLAGFRCRACGADSSRLATAHEMEIFEHYGRHTFTERPAHNVHALWHAFCAEVRDDDGAWKLDCEALMDACARWASRHPDEIRCVGVDNAWFTSSMLVLFEHRADRKYMGTTALYISQSTDPPVEFFLYPRAADALRDALADIACSRRERVDAEAADDKAFGEETSKWRP